MAHLTHSIEDAVATIVLNNPPQNRLSSQMLDELDAALNDIESSQARALLLRAEGADFSFGGDIVPWPEMTERELRTLFERYMNSFNRFERLPIPTVADRKSTRLNSSHQIISYAVFCLKKKKKNQISNQV